MEGNDGIRCVAWCLRWKICDDYYCKRVSKQSMLSNDLTGNEQIPTNHYSTALDLDVKWSCLKYFPLVWHQVIWKRSHGLANGNDQYKDFMKTTINLCASHHHCLAQDSSCIWPKFIIIIITIVSRARGEVHVWAVCLTKGEGTSAARLTHRQGLLPSGINPEMKHATPPSNRTKERVPFLPILWNHHVQ